MALIPVSPRDTTGLPRLLVLRALGLGDLLTAVPALRALGDAYPSHERVLATPAFLAPLVEMLDGAVDAIVSVDWRARTGQLPATPGTPDIAVNLHGRGPQSHRALLAQEPSQFVAWHHPDIPQTTGHPTWVADEHERVRWCRLLCAAGIPANADDYLLRPPLGGLPPEFAGVTLVHPGASAPSRRWPPERWAAVARAELERGHQVVITGNADEVDLAKSVALQADLGGQWVVAGRTDIEELAALVGAAGRVVSGDTGVAHLATAFAIPSVVLFGPTSPAQWGPPDGGLHRALWAGKTGDPHAHGTDPGLLRVAVDDVVDALDALPTHD